jgi:hypothetical protein
MRTLCRALLLSLVAACSTTSTSNDGGLGPGDGARTNACLAYGQGYLCQSGMTCSPGYVNKEDLPCASTGQLCCGPVGDGGGDASDDAQVFVDGAVFDTGPADATVHDAGHDAGGHDATTHDAAVESGAKPADGGGDALTHDAGGAHEAGGSHDDGGSDAGHAAEDSSIDARHG